MLTRHFSIVILALLVTACTPTEEQAPVPSAQEAESAPVPDEHNVQDDIVGTWQSNNESSLTVRYGADGTVNVVSTAEGGMAFAGTWTVVDPATEDVGVAADTLTGITVLRLQYPNATAVYIGIKNVTATTLQTVELGSDEGKVATFTRIQ